MELQLFINKKEYDFSNQVSFHLHPYNFSSFVFHNVIPKELNVYPKNLKLWKIDEFSLAEVYNNGELIFVGLANASGRLSLFKNVLKTCSLEITDIRKWLSLTQPINLVVNNVTPYQLLETILRETTLPNIGMGYITFKQNSDLDIKSYSLKNKTLWQLLKEVIAPLTNSHLYFTVDQTDGVKLLVNYKTFEEMENNVSPKVLDLTQDDVVEKLKILSLEYTNEINSYANMISLSSENIQSQKPLQDVFTLGSEETAYARRDIFLLDDKNCWLEEDGVRRPLNITEIQKLEEGDYYDVTYQAGNREINFNPTLIGRKIKIGISYYYQTYWVLEDRNVGEVNRIKSISHSDGIVFQSDKFNDVTSLLELEKRLNFKLQNASSPRNRLVLQTRELTWDINETVEVKTEEPSLNGKYFIQSIDGEVLLNKRDYLGTYTYTLNSYRNLDEFTNFFDNQNYRTNILFNEQVVVTQTINQDVCLLVEYENQSSPNAQRITHNELWT